MEGNHASPSAVNHASPSVAATTAHGGLVQHTPTCDVLTEIQQVVKDIENLVALGPENDPEYKENVKKLNDIKNYLSRKMDPNKRGILGKFRRNRGRVQMRTPSGTELMEETPSELMMDEDFYHEDQKPDIINMNLDDSILKAVDDLISAYVSVAGFIKDHIRSP